MFSYDLFIDLYMNMFISYSTLCIMNLYNYCLIKSSQINPLSHVTQTVLSKTAVLESKMLSPGCMLSVETKVCACSKFHQEWAVLEKEASALV